MKFESRLKDGDSGGVAIDDVTVWEQGCDDIDRGDMNYDMYGRKRENLHQGEIWRSASPTSAQHCASHGDIEC